MKHALKHIHFVGVGGAGMSAIAEVLHQQGYRVSGSDQVGSAVTRRLAALGVAVHIGHAAAHIAGAQAVVTSTAVQADNPEVLAAREQRVPVVPRAVLLAELMRGSRASPLPARTARPRPPRCRQRAGRGRPGPDLCHRRPAAGRWRQRAPRRRRVHRRRSRRKRRQLPAPEPRDQRRHQHRRRPHGDLRPQPGTAARRVCRLPAPPALLRPRRAVCGRCRRARHPAAAAAARAELRHRAAAPTCAPSMCRPCPAARCASPRSRPATPTWPSR